ncbi:MAG: FAD-binding and (Fe-S)-binding domain-containing protein [Rhodothermales bacterium]
MATPPSALPDFLGELRKRVNGALRTDTYSKVLYSTDASIYQVMPHGVLIPEHDEHVHAAVELAAKYEIPLLPRTAGSSLAGQAVNEAVVIDFSRYLNKIVEVNEEEQWVQVQPGIVLDELNLHLQPYDLQFGPDPASSNRAAMGGIVSNNSTGSHSIMYGMTTDHVMDMDVILSDGTKAHLGPVSDDELKKLQARSGLEGQIYTQIAGMVADPGNADIIRQGTPRHWRRCGGYNLDRLIDGGVSFKYPQRDDRFNLAKIVSGAEGTFAVMTGMKLNIVRKPTKTALAIVHFENLFEALQAVPVILEVDPSAVELLDNLGLTLCREVPDYARLLDSFIEGEPNCVLMTEFYGESDSELKSKVDKLKLHLKKQGVNSTAVVSAFDADHQAKVWKVRKVGLGLLMSIKGDHKPIPFIEDAAVPVEHLAEYVTKVEQFCNDRGTDVAYYAHASAGCVHIRPLVNTKEASEVAKLPEITSFSVDLLKGYGGSLSSEHGDGRARSGFNQQFFGPELYGLYKQAKDIFDPKGILNPGNVVDAGPMTEQLRYGSDYAIMPLQDHIDFKEDKGFHRAVEMCNGAGICRKTTTGTMCPSFMATREEEHSTRGRANALRAALSGNLPNKELTSKRMYEVMDLCIECKACKAECPSSVDMAKIKFEFLAQYHDANGTPLRTRLFGNISSLTAMTSGWMAPMANFMIKRGPVRWMMEKAIGISRKRTLPAFARTSFNRWFAKRAGQNLAANKVVLFNDTFNTYNSPEVAIAATEVLEAAGFQVILPGHRCCGRPMISKGLVQQARAAAKDTVAKLAPYAKEGIPIIGLEPSCLLSLKDEYLHLLPENEDAKLVAAHAVMFEEFIAGLAEENKLNLDFEETERRLLLHGHCHQKALVGTVPSKAILSLPDGYAVEEVDSGCCGMAGSFGYEEEHYDISLKMAERRLLPAVRKEKADTVLVAAGFSCRHQIKDGTGREALHPAQVLRDALKK